MLDKKELREQVESSFKPYHCGVEFLPTGQPYWDELGIQLSDEDNKLPVFKRTEPRSVVEDILDKIIEMWREEAIAMGYQLNPL